MLPQMMLGCLFHPFVKKVDRFLDEPDVVCGSRKENTSWSKAEEKTYRPRTFLRHLDLSQEGFAPLYEHSSHHQ